jgi:hypothetical protein
MSSNRRNAKREAKKSKDINKGTLEERKKAEKSYGLEEAMNFDESDEAKQMS